MEKYQLKFYAPVLLVMGFALLDILVKSDRIAASGLAFSVVFFDLSVFGSVANIEGIGVIA